MLYDEINVQDVVDSEAAMEFMKEATKLATSTELEDIGLRLEKKSKLFSDLLSEDHISDLTENEFRHLVGSIFSIKRKANRILKANGFESLQQSITDLLYGEDTIDLRFNRFIDSVHKLDGPMRVNFASELLHFSNPKKYWLWTNWIWDSKTGTGSLPLIVQEGVDLSGKSDGEIYGKVGQSLALVNAVGHSIGFSDSGKGLFGTDVFLACVYAVYMYTVFRVKLSQEFNRILPELSELAQRVLGVYKMEMN
ncbi:MAG: hypothetical protein HN927_07125 [Candidatus Marinimicrobia bacterium]|mgnify:FL=1|jgi:hypothetical protein|nr:hypothetical protein [Candidatus Neomarinimicrobiota bacterium]MBT6781325.1 hypothetical protein [Candidatus Neomarinimicrobiota bacterium]MBT6942687.1 hypothetical protein [Candidatus Neomarinimicrobiota bacterium]MBT7084003.1 hypothetical protein [Candidatus Neomarinimicrobiota bacterium]MBT7922242.1 hypothetical protein [Candidatus Neomarinimicrobiota bacterium]